MATAHRRTLSSKDRLALCQDRRRSEALQRQREARRNLADHARALTAPEPAAPRMEVEAGVSKAESKRLRQEREAKERAARWSGEFCIPEWLVEIPRVFAASVRPSVARSLGRSVARSLARARARAAP